ncbi:LuxR C-terminal-related transcriptional regulator [Segetibacter aerophilus]|uniref:HTH luxR-type domain-containing protein n=1 Tax=Segetibacter aerophilus TaxID=670293 RepID=A0A512BEF6_9BACT|nr:LuxR C-terminal-related transcriptional regulator [Segetibacter aerophilus]GEO10356.1 hypothetical protein SAE01_28520 [Segetibacter aerophilus]
MKPEIFNKANKIWTKITENSKEEDLEFSLDIHKKLLSFFQVGEYYYYIFNLKESKFELMSKDVTKVLGYEPEEVDVPFLLSNIHPEDQPWFLNFENKVSEFFQTLKQEQIPNYKVRYDYRVRCKNGEYIRILQQVVTIQFDQNKILRTFGVHTDITHIKEEGSPVLSFIGLNGEPSFIGVKVKDVFSPSKIALTKREQEVLALLIEGKKSEDISQILFISKQTVDTHRKNLLKKTNCSNTALLTSTAIKKGWV